MTLEEFKNFDGDMSDLTDLDLLPLLFKSCPPTYVLRDLIFVIRSFPVDTVKACLDLVNLPFKVQ